MITLRPYQLEATKEALAALSKNDDPVLFVMSVGGGKSICIANIMATMENLGKRALCLVSSAELVRNNSETYKSIGFEPSVFCASLGQKDISNPCVFATPQSISSALKSGHPVGDIPFNIILVDEAHGIAYDNHASTFMRILRYYKTNYPSMRVLGFTGTPFRGDTSIVGEHCLFNSQVANITTQWLIKRNYLVPAYFGTKDIPGFDMAKLKADKLGNFSNNDLELAIGKTPKLTHQIIMQVMDITKHRNGVFIFGSTRKHCEHIMDLLPETRSGLILGDTPSSERSRLLQGARNGEIDYLVSVNCLLVGVDIPRFDTCAWLRPTSSLLLFTQGVGRALRLHPDKKSALILDYAGNLERFGDIDDPLINEALQPRADNEQDYVIPCLKCNTTNTVHARRCRGVIDNQRCDFFFTWRECPKCMIKNDSTARMCRQCDYELIDPNMKLTFSDAGNMLVDVEHVKYWTLGRTFYATYNGNITESYTPTTIQSKNIFYGRFIKSSVKNPSKYYPLLSYPKTINKLVESGDIKIPYQLECTKRGDKYHIVKRFYEIDT